MTVSRRELARHLRIYGGPSLETRRDDANATAWLSACLACIGLFYAEIFGGWGVSVLPQVSAWLAFIAAMIFADAMRRRNKHERRIADVEAVSLCAIAAAIAEGDQTMARAA